MREVAGVAALLVGLLVVCIAGWYLIGRAFGQEPREATFLRRLFLAALALRLAVAVGTYYWLPYGFFAPDEAGYVLSAKALIAGHHSSLAEVLNGEGWQYFNFLLFHLLGVNPLLPRLWNCAVGATLVVVSYSLARNLGAGSHARWTAILVGAFPSVVLWSSLNLKDADVWLLIVSGLLISIRLQEPRRFRYALALVFIVCALVPLRQYAAEAMLAAVGVSIIASFADFQRELSIAGGLLAACIIVAALVFPRAAESAFHAVGLAKLATLRHDFAIGARSAINPDPGLGTLHGTLTFLPTGLRDFFLRPFPWETGGALSTETRPEAIAYYVLLVVVVIGIVYSLKKCPQHAIPPITFLVVAGIGYALVIANLGTIYREREQLIVVMFAFVGAGISAIQFNLTWWHRSAVVQAGRGLRQDI